jgi:hypothetical protein
VTGPVRSAGHGRRADGAIVTWTVAEGQRGRRWRETVVADGGWHSLLFETATDGTFSHLELASSAGLVTLHPEGDGTLHGNVVDAAGVHHVEAWPYPTGTVVQVVGSVVAGATLTWAGAQPGALAIVLDPATGKLAARALTPDDLVSVDPDGRPLLVDGTTWPLER